MQFEPRDQFEQRQKKLQQIQQLGHDAFPREFRWTDTPAALFQSFSEVPGPELEANKREVRVAGRLVSYRLMGKAGFAHLQGGGGKIQIYVKKDVVGEKGFELFHLLDLLLQLLRALCVYCWRAHPQGERRNENDYCPS